MGRQEIPRALRIPVAKVGESSPLQQHLQAWALAGPQTRPGGWQFLLKTGVLYTHVAFNRGRVTSQEIRIH